MHVESGGNAENASCRASQLQYLAVAALSPCVLAGDFNMRPGDGRVLLNHRWRELACADVNGRYNRLYMRGRLECLRCATLRGYKEIGLTYHKPLPVEMRI